MVGQDGTSKCHTCGHEWKDDTFQASDGGSSDLSSTANYDSTDKAWTDPASFSQRPSYDSNLELTPDQGEDDLHIGDNEENPTWSTDWIKELERKYPEIASMSEKERAKFFGKTPTRNLLDKAGALDSFAEPEEDIEIDESSHTWKDESGEPLQEGEEYEIYANNYDIPDVGRLDEIKPDSLVYTIESNGGLHTTIEIDRKEADLNGYRFSPTGGSSEDNPAGIGDKFTDGKPDVIPAAGSESSDGSSPHIQIGSNTKTAGQHYTPMEQRALIDEYGEARNADKLNLEGTHYAESDPDYFLFGC